MRSSLLAAIVLSAASAAQNLIQDGNFDASPTLSPWITPPGGATLGSGLSGNAAILACQDANSCQIYQPVGTDRATTYNLSFYLLSGQTSGQFAAVFGLNSQNDAIPVSSIPGFLNILPSNASTGWTMFSVVAPGDGPGDRVLFAAMGEWAIDNVSLVAISPSSSPSAPGATDSPSQTPPTTPTSTGSVGLSGGAIAGISVGAVIAVCGLLTAMFKFGSTYIKYCGKRHSDSKA